MKPKKTAILHNPISPEQCQENRFISIILGEFYSLAAFVVVHVPGTVEGEDVRGESYPIW